MLRCIRGEGPHEVRRCIRGEGPHEGAPCRVGASEVGPGIRYSLPAVGRPRSRRVHQRRALVRPLPTPDVPRPSALPPRSKTLLSQLLRGLAVKPPEDLAFDRAHSGGGGRVTVGMVRQRGADRCRLVRAQGEEGEVLPVLPIAPQGRQLQQERLAGGLLREGDA